jgi:two-component system response regulator YesN
MERNALRLILNKGIDFRLEIREAANGREAIATSKSFSPDIVFMDIKMPGINGMEAVRSIKEINPFCRIIFLTAYSQFDYAREAIKIGVDDYLLKPASEDQVLKIIGTLIKKLEESKSELSKRTNREIKLNEITEYLENEFLYSLTHSGLSEEKFHDYLSIMDMHFISGIACICKILYETYPLRIESAYQKKILKKRCAYIIRESLRNKGFPCLYNLDITNIYFLIMNQDDRNILDTETLKTCLETIRLEIKNQLTLDIIFGVGDEFRQPGESHKSFFSAQKGLVSPLRETKEISPLDIEDDLIQSVLNGDLKELSTCLGRLNFRLKSSDYASQDKESIFTAFSRIICQEIEVQFSIKIRKNKAIPDFRIIKYNDQFKIFSDFMTDLCKDIRKVQRKAVPHQLSGALKFIEENFNKDITLEETAAQSQLSSFYFCKLFKQQLEMNFIDYLTKRRIGEAKNLLMESSLSIKEISYRIGYNDPNYFTRVFRKLENLSPSQYRSNKMLSGQNNPEQ